MAGSVSRSHVRWAVCPNVAADITAVATGDPQQVYTLSDPAIVPGHSLIETEPLYIERYHDDGHTFTGIRTPAISGLEVPFNAYGANRLLATLFQSGVNASGVKTLTSFQVSNTNVIDSTDTGANSWGQNTLATPLCVTLQRIFSDTQAADGDHALMGGVCTSATISGDVGGIVTMSTDWIGFDYAYDQALNAPAAAIDTHGKAYPFNLFDGSTYYIGIGDPETPAAITCRSFSITIANGATAAHYAQQEPGSIGFAPKLMVTGEIVVRMDAETAVFPAVQKVKTNLEAGTPTLLVISNNADGSVPTGDVNGEWQILCNMLSNGDPTSGEGETVYDLTIPFKGIYEADAQPDISIVMDDAIDAGWDVS